MKFDEDNVKHSVSGTLHLLQLVGKSALFWDSSTGEAGFAVLMTADEAISKGNGVCYIQGGTVKRVKKVPTTGNEQAMCIGIALTAAAGVASTFWVCTSGTVQILPVSTITATLGYVLYSGGEAGCADQSAGVPAATTHFMEWGHWAENGTGNGALALATIHFN